MNTNKIKTDDYEANHTNLKANEIRAAEEQAEKSGKSRLKKAIANGFASKETVKLNLTTTGILLQYVFCRICKSRQSLRNNPNSRQDYYFYQGLDKLNKEGDISYLIKNIRIMRYFLKTVLSKDQRVLLNLKKSENVSSDSDSSKEFPVERFRKKVKSKVVLDRYTDFIRKKDITEEDARLFKVLGQMEAYNILIAQKEKEKGNSVEDHYKRFLRQREKQ